MKKFSFIVLVIIFIACVALGFVVMNQVYGPDASPLGIQSASTQSANLVALEQINYLVIQVDNLESDSPELVSVWLAFIYTGNQPQLILLPLLPTANSSQAATITQDFSLTSNKDVTGVFIKNIQSTFDIEFEGYFLLDNAGLTAIGQWLTGSDMGFLQHSASQDSSVLDVLQPSKDYLSQVCKSIRSNGSESGSQIRWAQLIPAHFRTTVSFDNLMRLWDTISSSKKIRCEITIP